MRFNFEYLALTGTDGGELWAQCSGNDYSDTEVVRKEPPHALLPASQRICLGCWQTMDVPFHQMLCSMASWHSLNWVSTTLQLRLQIWQTSTSLQRCLAEERKAVNGSRSSASLRLPPLIIEHLLQRNGITEEQELMEAWGNCCKHSHLHHVIKTKWWGEEWLAHFVEHSGSGRRAFLVMN